MTRALVWSAFTITGSGSDTLSLISLVVSGLSLAVAVSSLTWQITNYLLTGARVKVRLLRGATSPSHLMTFPLKRGLSDFDREQGFTDEVLVIEARNIGRLAVTVTGVRAVLKSGQAFLQSQFPPERQLPYRLEAQSEQQWYVPLDTVRALSNSVIQVQKPWRVGRYRRVYLAISLGNGKTVKTRTFRLPR